MKKKLLDTLKYIFKLLTHVPPDNFREGPKILAGCGHLTYRCDTVTAHGESIYTTIKLEDPPYCHKCLGKMAIPCAWCYRPIFIGDRVTLYEMPENKKLDEVPEVSVYSKQPIRLIGCHRSDCADSAMDYLGTWEPPGVVKRFSQGPFLSYRQDENDINTVHLLHDSKETGVRILVLTEEQIGRVHRIVDQIHKENRKTDT